MAYLPGLLQYLRGQALSGVPGEEVYGPPIGRGDAGHIVGGFCPALYLQTAHPRLYEPWDMLYHAQVV